ncbi:MAG: DUF951 domain-containing protein [Clostridia bacterium]|nr:DUF951 domain-containing protein [Clostridia bacterium]
MPIFRRQHKGGFTEVKIITFSQGDILEMKKPHPCGASRMRVLRVGSDVRVVCLGCERDMTIPRVKLERAVKRVIMLDDENLSK